MSTSQSNVFEPWERSPNMLAAYHRACGCPGGERLQLQAADAVLPAAHAVLQDRDPAYVEDVGVILTTMAYGAIARQVDGDLDITEILPTLERGVARLTGDNVRCSRRVHR